LTAVSGVLYEQPLSVTCDFERAFINASKKVFPESEVSACYFHYRQCIWRKIQEHGLVNLYGTHDSKRSLIKQMQAIAFVPVDEVHDVYDKLKIELNKHQELSNLVSYFEKTLIGERKRNRNGSITRKPPLFEHKLWNLNKRVVNNCPNTNNSVESWNKVFSSMLCAHP